MSSYNKAVALQYGDNTPAPIVVASGAGHMAEKIVEVAGENNVPVYEDTSLATVLSQLSLGQQIPDTLYQTVVEIYAYFLRFDADKHTGPAGAAESATAQEENEEGEGAL